MSVAIDDHELNHTSRGNELRHRLISPTASARSDFKQLAERVGVLPSSSREHGRTHIRARVSRDERDFPCGLNTRMNHVPPPTRCFISSSFVLVTPRVSAKVPLRTYAEQISLDELPANTLPAVGPIRFNSVALSFRLSPSFFFQSVSISDLHDPHTPWRTIDPRLTLLGVVSLDSTLYSPSLSLSLSLLSFFSLLSCSLMRGRHHLEYRFISFRIVIDFAPFLACTLDRVGHFLQVSDRT